VTTFEIVNEIAARASLRFLVIGGHAVNAYGYTRFTEDVDILVNRDEKTVWITELSAKGFGLYHDGGAFLQLTAPQMFSPLDLMLVNSTTFEKLSRETKAAEISGAKVQIPSLYNLFALKIHVLQQDLPHRGFKDFMDILSLAQCNGVDLRSDKIRELCEKYGNKKIYERLLAFKG
jgi:hypothetical protein